MLSHLLPQFKLFDGVTVGLLEHLEDALIKRDFGAEQIVFQCDDPPTGFYLVLSGRVKVFRDSPRGQEQILGFFEAGDSFAEAALFQPGYPASAATLVPTELLFVNKNRFLARLAENPELTFKLLIELASKQKRLVTLIEDLTGILLLLVIIGGRVVPFFTSKALSSTPQKWNPVEVLAILSILSLPFLGYLPNWALWLWTLTMFLTHSLRIRGWYHPGVWKEPLLWVLYLGFAWIPVGGALLGLGYLGLVPVSAGIHAFTSGTIGVVGIGIMARASLGHTGRPLKAPSTVVLAFGLVVCGSVVRVFGPLAGVSYSVYLIGGGSLWSLGYLLFFLTYLPILTGPRADAGLS